MLKYEDMHKFFTSNTFFFLVLFSFKKNEMEEKDIKEDQKDLSNIIFNQCKLCKLKGKIFR